MKCISIVGQTATGKSDFAIELAKRVGGEIVSVDSVLVYKGLDIGSAKLSIQERGGITHHLIDIVEPDFSFTAGEFTRHAKKAIDDIVCRGKVPVFCGGTYFYYQALKYGMWEVPSIPLSIVEKYNEIFLNKGVDGLVGCLEKIDPKSLDEIARTDRYRLQRALEIFSATGKTRSEIKSEFLQNRKPFFEGVEYAFLVNDKSDLTKRIEARTQKMLDNGFEQEVRSLLDNGGSPQFKSLQSVGYREMVSYVNGTTGLQEMKTAIVRNTLLLAKHQKTWLKKQDYLEKIDVGTSDMKNVLAQMEESWKLLRRK